MVELEAFRLNSKGGGAEWNQDVGDRKVQSGAAWKPQRGRSGHGQRGGRGRMGKGKTEIHPGRGAGAGADDAEPAGGDELHPAVGEIDGNGGEGGASGVYGGGKPNAGSEPKLTADRRVPAQGGRVRAAAETGRERGRRQRDVAVAAEPVADRGGAREGIDGTGFLGGVAAVGGRGSARRR